MKISKAKRKRILELREEGLGYGTIAKRVKVSKSGVAGVVRKAMPPEPEPEPSGPVEARVLKPFPNPRIIGIYFGERKEERYGKCVVRVDGNYPPNARINVLPVEGEDGLYRLA